MPHCCCCHQHGDERVVEGCWLTRQEHRKKKRTHGNYANFYKVQHWLVGKCFITCHQPQVNNCPCHGFFPYCHFSTLPHPHVVSNRHQNNDNSWARTWVCFFLVILFIYSSNEYFQIDYAKWKGTTTEACFFYSFLYSLIIFHPGHLPFYHLTTTTTADHSDRSPCHHQCSVC